MAFALSRDGNFFRQLAEVHRQFHTPHVAIVVQFLLSSIVLMFGGNFRQLFTLSLFAEWLSYVTAASSLFVFKSSLKSKSFTSERPSPFWRYPLAPALFIVASAALLYYTFMSNLRSLTVGSLVILAGIPVYYAFALRRRTV
jgi:APA family basic amino acid/polyamine antiporter